MIRACSKCKKKFHCNANNTTTCWCIKIKVTVDTLEKMNRDYSGCTCKKCFTKITSNNSIP